MDEETSKGQGWFTCEASYIQLRKEKRGRNSRRDVGDATDIAPRAPAPGRYKRPPSGEVGAKITSLKLLLFHKSISHTHTRKYEVANKS